MDGSFEGRRNLRVGRLMDLLRGQKHESASDISLVMDRVAISRILEDFGVAETRDVYDLCLERVIGSYPDSDKETAVETLVTLLENDADAGESLNSGEICEAITRLVEIEKFRQSALWLLILCLSRFDHFALHILRSPFMENVLVNTAAGVSVLYPILLREILELTAGNVEFDYQSICDSCTARLIESSNALEKEILLECIFIMVKRKVANPFQHWISSFLDLTTQMPSNEAVLFFGILVKMNYQCTSDVLARALQIAQREDTDELKYISRMFHFVEYDQWMDLEQKGAITQIVRSTEWKNAKGKRYIGMIILGYLQDTWTESREPNETLISCFSALIECLPVMPTIEFLEAMKQIEQMLESPHSEFFKIATNLDLGGVIRDHLSGTDSKGNARCERILQTYFD